MSLLIIYLVKKFWSVGKSEVESEVASLRVRWKAEGESLAVAGNVSNPSFRGIHGL
jgi:hypothetical protein